MKRIGILALLLWVAPLSAKKYDDDSIDPDPAEVPASASTAEKPKTAGAEKASIEKPDVDDATADEPATSDESAMVEEPPSSSLDTASEKAAPAAEPAATPLEKAAPAEPLAVVTPVETPALESYTGASYRVKKGDTLWDLAQQYLGNPYAWTQIWDANKGVIQNPDLIYPDQEVSLPTKSAAREMTSAAEAPVPGPAVEAPAAGLAETAPSPTASLDASAAEPAAAPEPAAEAPAPAKSAQKTPEPVEIPAEPEVADDQAEIPVEKPKAVKLPTKIYDSGAMGWGDDSFLADDSWEYDAHIIRDQDRKLMIAMGDVVYLNVGAASGIKPKMKGAIFRIGKGIRDPFNKGSAGIQVRRVGTLSITDQVTDRACTAVVTNSLEPIRIGDVVRLQGK